MRRIAACLLALTPQLALAQVQCGGDFGAFVDRLKAEAVARGQDRGTVDAFFAPCARIPRCSAPTGHRASSSCRSSSSRAA